MKLVALLLFLILVLMSCFGLWNFVNSQAAEAQSWKVVNMLMDGFILIARGVFAILLAVAIYFLCRGIRDMSEPVARATGTYMLSRRASQLMIPDSGVKTPDIQIYPPVRARIIGDPHKQIEGALDSFSEL